MRPCLVSACRTCSGRRSSERRGAVARADGRGGARDRHPAAAGRSARRGRRGLHARFSRSIPNHPRALHFAGVLAHQVGRSERRRRADREEPGARRRTRPTGTATSASSCRNAGRLDEAIDAYHRAIALDPTHANAYSNLGVLLRATGKPVEAEAAYRTAIRLNPEHIDAYTNLGILLNGLKRTRGSRSPASAR